MKWLVRSTRVTSTLARPSTRAAEMPPNPPPIITTRGRLRESGKSLLERSGGERHQQNQHYKKHTVGCGRSECQGAQLRQDLHGNRSIGVRVEYDAGDKFS